MLKCFLIFQDFYQDTRLRRIIRLTEERIQALRNEPGHSDEDEPSVQPSNASAEEFRSDSERYMESLRRAGRLDNSQPRGTESSGSGKMLVL